MHVACRKVSSIDQSLERQLVDHDGIERVFEEEVSGASRNRPELEKIIAFVREGYNAGIQPQLTQLQRT